MKCVRAFLNFIMLTSYKSQNENILKYMTKILRRVNKLKIEFTDFRFVFKKIEKSHFNFFKFHVMSHYIKFIRLYDSADQFDISHMKMTHKYLMKIFYQWTNKNENYQDQILWHNTRRINMLTMKNIFYHMINQKRSNATVKMKAYATRFNRAINLHKIDIKISKRVLQTIQFQELKRDEWCIIHELKEQFEISDLINAATVFVKENRKKKKKCAKYNVTKINRRKKNFSWMKNFFVRVHIFVKCWIKHDQNKKNTKKLKEETVRCSSTWRKKIKNWRRDHIWMRDEFENIRSNFVNNELTSFEMKLLDQLQICVNIRNVKLMNAEKKSTLHYEALVKIFRLKNNESFNQIHEIFKIKHWSKS